MFSLFLPVNIGASLASREVHFFIFLFYRFALFRAKPSELSRCLFYHLSDICQGFSFNLFSFVSDFLAVSLSVLLHTTGRNYTGFSFRVKCFEALFSNSVTNSV